MGGARRERVRRGLTARRPLAEQRADGGAAPRNAALAGVVEDGSATRPREPRASRLVDCSFSRHDLILSVLEFELTRNLISFSHPVNHMVEETQNFTRLEHRFDHVLVELNTVLPQHTASLA